MHVFRHCKNNLLWYWINQNCEEKQQHLINVFDIFCNLVSTIYIYIYIYSYIYMGLSSKIITFFGGHLGFPLLLIICLM